MKKYKSHALCVAFLQWCTQTVRSEQRERNSDCCALRQSRLRQRTVLSHIVHCTDTTCLVRLLCPLRTVSANATRLPLPLLAVSNRYRIRWGASEKCRDDHGILNGATPWFSRCDRKQLSLLTSGAPKRIRTANRQNRNLMRYPVAPWVHICILSFFAVFVERKRTIGAFSTRISGSIETFRLF